MRLWAGIKYTLVALALVTAGNRVAHAGIIVPPATATISMTNSAGKTTQITGAPPLSMGGVFVLGVNAPGIVASTGGATYSVAATATYYLAALGSVPGLVVPIDVTETTYAFGQQEIFGGPGIVNGSSASAEIGISGTIFPNGPPPSVMSCSPGCAVSFASKTLSINIYDNAIYALDITVMSSSETAGASVNASASVALDSDFAAENPGVSLAFNNGVGVPVPEPAAWPFFWMGVSAICWLRRHRTSGLT